MKNLTNFLILSICVLLTASCANYKLNLSDDAKGWEQNQPAPSLALTHTMYLVGDAGGYIEPGYANPVLKYVKGQLAGESANSSLLFLGDNIYPDGLYPKSDEENREISEYRLNAQLELTDDWDGVPLFIPGNHDWKQGLKGLKRQEKYVNKYINEARGVEDDDDDDWEEYFLPENGCPGPEIIEIGKKLVIVVVDSEWWLQDWDKQPKINDDCLAKNRTMFQFLFLNALKKYRSRNVVVAVHHPPYTNGPHGGNFTAKEHIFPLTELNENLYIPLPGIGSIYALLRGTIASKQDLGHQLYRDLRDGMMASAKTYGSFIFVSGHEHNLQYLENDEQKFVVSGSGSKLSPSRIGRGAKFAYGTSGFSTLKFYDNGEVWVEFFEVKKGEGKLVYRQKVKGELSIIEENIPEEFPEFAEGKDTAEVLMIQNKVLDAGPVHKLMLGDHHRDVYMEKYRFPVLDLTEFDGGVIPVKRGGGSQTNSLRLENPKTGKQFAMRALTKDVSRILPYPINKMTAAKVVMEDFFLSSHPFAPMVIPPMADAINIYHTNPTYYYVPKQPALGVNNDLFGGDVYLVEERPAGDYSDATVFGGSEKIVSTFDVAEKITKNNNHKVDQPWTLRSRLFDMLIGDFDRHDDQWRWARFEIDGKKIYRPIPRDRDQPFSKYDGVLVVLARITTPFVRQLRVYGPKINTVRYLAWSSLPFDNSFITELEWEDWQREVKFIQENLTDEVIDDAFKVWPTQVEALTGEHTRNSLKQRRDDLEIYAREFYEILSKEVDVYGTDERELFEVERVDDERTRVSVWEISNKKGKKKEKVYERVFETGVTKEVHIFGVGDDDEFRVSGDVSKGIKIRCVGGLGNDVFVDESKVSGPGKKTFFYDDLRKNELTLGSEARDMRSNDRELNLYDRRSTDHEYDFLMPLPILGRNPDDGFLLGFAGILTTYKFRKIPYSTLQSFSATYAFETQAFNAEYVGDFLNRFGEWDFWLEAHARTPSYAFNYFGFGNGSEKMETRGREEVDFYRVRQSDYYVAPAFKRRIAGNAGFFRFGPVLQMTDIEATEGRFIVSEDAGLDPGEDFERKFFAGAELGFELVSLDNFIAPKRGASFLADLGYRQNLDQTERRVLEMNAELSVFQPVNRKETIIFATRFGFGHNFGENFDFFQAQRIGGGITSNLRGYRSDRFFGQTSYWQNLDMRAKLFSSYNRTLPFTFGIFTGFDYGRVWSDNDTSDDWHYNYGGGLYIAPVDILTMSFGLYQPKEDNEDGPRFVFKMGFGF